MASGRRKGHHAHRCDNTNGRPDVGHQMAGIRISKDIGVSAANGLKNS
jgi:hypothetical protein